MTKWEARDVVMVIMTLAITAPFFALALAIIIATLTGQMK